MKKLAFLPAILLIAFTFTSCCISCKGSKGYGVAGAEQEYIEVEETEWIEEEVYSDPGAKGGKGGTVTVRRPVVKTVRKAVECGSCGSWYCPSPGCCDTVSGSVLRRATAQGGSGEPHIGQIPTMKILAPKVN